MRWAQLPDYQRATGGRLYGLLLSGDVVALAVLAEALVLALVLLAVPWLRTRGLRRAQAPDHARNGATGSAGPVVAYNLAVGLGFILLELMLIQRLTVALGDPVVSFKVVLGALLVWSAAGGLLSERIAPPRTWLAVAAVAGVVLAYAAAGPALLTLLLGLPRIPARGVHRDVARSPGRGPRHGVPARPAPVGAGCRQPRPGLGRQRLRLGGGRRRQHPARRLPGHHRPGAW